MSTAKLSRYAAGHPWRVAAAWIVVLGIGLALVATLLSDALTTEFVFTNTPES